VGEFRDRISAEPRARLRFIPDATRAHLFEEATGKRVD
jgi:hypothetical protein